MFALDRARFVPPCESRKWRTRRVRIGRSNCSDHSGRSDRSGNVNRIEMKINMRI